MKKNRNTILILLLVGVLFQMGTFSRANESKPIEDKQKLSQSKDKIEENNSFEIKTAKEPESAKLKNEKEEEAIAKNKNHKENKKMVTDKIVNQDNQRQVASETAYSCTEFWTDEFSAGYIQLGSNCSPDENLCLAFFHIERNYCEGDYLIRYYCDPKQPALFSTEKIKCKKSCGFSGLSDTCLK